MKYIRDRKLFKFISLFLALNLLLELCSPMYALALTAGPNSPEFSSFEPVATTDMVNPFTGDFTYNLPVLEIPGPDGAGYAMSLSYHSGASIEEEPSWVGYGWTLNPGAINRGTRGFPDDYNGAVVTQYNKTLPNWSASASLAYGLEIKSMDEAPEVPAQDFIQTYTSKADISARKSLRFNNYQGFSRQVGFNVGVKGYGSLGMTQSADGITFNATVDLAGILQRGSARFAKETDNSPAAAVDKKTLGKYLKNKIASSVKAGINQSFGSTYGLYSYSEAVRATSANYFKGRSFNWSTGITFNPAPAPVGFQTGVTGNFNMQWNLKTILSAYGYMHNPTSGNGSSISDYYIEKGNPYSKRDYFLGLPFNNADSYMVTGEALSGGFRYYPEDLRQFYPTHANSKTTIAQMGVELDVVANIGIGVDFGLGYNKLSVQDWKNMGSTVKDKFDNSGGGGVFRFNNDLGGKIEYGNNELTTAKINKTSWMPGAKSCVLSSDPDQLASTWTNENTGSSSYIEKIGNTSRIEGFSIVNEDGMKYEYGKPVYSRNETSLQFDIKKENRPEDKYLAYQETHLASDFKVDESRHRSVIGEVRNEKYASSCLLTAITSPDYVDLGDNGPDSLDFGAWTSFSYQQVYGESNWYRWRTPYQGLLYNMGDISSAKDDMGSLQTGEKEVYYLKAIETKTHIAYFVTNKTYASRFGLVPADSSFVKGSQKDRLDGYGAYKITGSADNAATGTKGDQQLEYLEKIVLFSKSRMDKPLRTVYFDYTYDLVQNLPNNINGKYPDDKDNFNSGKLTLKKVWFDSEGTFASMVSPYEFTYAYKDRTEFPQEILNRYPDILNSNLSYSDNAQNPDYDPHLMDSWGNVQMYGEERQKDLNPWPYQGVFPATKLSIFEGPYHWRNRIPQQTAGFFDPAAWQLKQIRLPSGGEILIDYEQKDYRYVQDREAMAMVSLIGYNDLDESNIDKPKIHKNPEYYLNLSDLGIEQDDPEFNARREEVMSKIRNYYGMDGGKEKLYFKFLYNISSSESIPGVDQCTSEFLTGYSRFKQCDTAYFGGKKCIRIIMEGENSSNGEYSHVPRRACYDFVATQRVGKVSTGGFPNNSTADCESSYEVKYDELIEKVARDDDDRFAKFGIVVNISQEMTDEMLSGTRFQIPHKISVCTDMNIRLSYLKIPMITAKRGGGIRVKRILMYDPGIETGDAALYGSEYHYVTEDGKSSGVATTEPSEMREENPLIKFMPRKDQSWYSRITAGQDKEQTEGPLGESILPSPSVGHSRVVVKNIHSGKTGTGFVVNEYFTVRDYPFDKQYPDGLGVESTPLSDNHLSDPLMIPAGLFSYSTNKVWTTQGFRFIINNMHGQRKKVSTYGGDYENPAESYLTSSQSYTYYQPGEKVKLINYVNGKYNVTEDVPGKEMDVTMEMNAVHDNTLDFSVEIDITIGIPTLTVFVGASPSIELDEKIIRTHTTTKVIRYPVLLKSVTSFQDGVSATTENMAFNSHNGQVAVTRTSDSYDKLKIRGNIHDGYVYNINIPASWHYAQMGQKAVNSSYTNQLNASAGSIVSYGTLGNPLMASGSELTWFSDPENVLSAGVQTFSNNWSSSWEDPLIDAQYQTASHAEDLNKIWRPHQSFVYKDSIVSANNAKIYNGGMFRTFDTYWENPSNPKWIKVNEVTRYSPHGAALEEYNVLQVPSAARFGYRNNIMPVMIANNSDYSSIYFEDYENNGDAVEGIAHSGRKSMQMNSGSALINTAEISSSAKLKQKGGILNFWLKEDADNTNELKPKVNVNGEIFTAVKVAKTGQWSLYRTEISGEAFTGNTYSAVLSFEAPTAGDVHVDDVKMQPVDAQVTCYVYDTKSLRLITQLDDWHFGMYYQYNDEGKLVRKQIETERGLKTIQETQYHTKKVNRP